jgi:hypothetical protein
VEKDYITRSFVLYSAYIIWVIWSRRLRGAGHAAGMGERRGAYRVLVGKPEERRPLEDPGVDGKMISTDL